MKYFLFHPDSPFIQFLNRIGRLIILNLLFVVTCIPIITIGAASTAMYSVTLKQAKNEEPYITRKYFQAFKENFLQSTVLWIFWLIAIVLLYVDFRVMQGRTSTFAWIMRIALYAVMLLAYMVMSYTFPLQASFYNTIRQTLKNGFFISIWHIKKTIPILLIPIAAIVITLLTSFTLYYGILLWIFLGFACCAQLKSHFFVQVFDTYINPPEDEVYDDEEYYEYAEDEYAEEAAEEVSEEIPAEAAEESEIEE